MPISISMSKMIFMKYLPPVRPKLIPKLKMLRIYWNLAHLVFWIFRSRFWCQKIFLLNIYHLLGPIWSQNQKGSEFIEIRRIWYFNVKNNFYETFTNRPCRITLSKIIAMHFGIVLVITKVGSHYEFKTTSYYKLTE